MRRTALWLALARSPGGKAGADPPSVHLDPRRLVAFSDAVFANTITRLVLDITPPSIYTNSLHGLLDEQQARPYGAHSLLVSRTQGSLDAILARAQRCWFRPRAGLTGVAAESCFCSPAIEPRRPLRSPR